MGKVTGFLEIDRLEQRYTPVGDRIRHFNEFLVPLDKNTLMQQGARCMDCGIPFCHTGCPVNNIIPDWNDLVYRDRVARSHRGPALDQQLSRIHRPYLSGALREACTLNISDAPVRSRPSNARSPTMPGRRVGGSGRARDRDRQGASQSSGRGLPGWPVAQQLGARRATTSRFLRNTQGGRGCSGTASPISRWRSTISTGASPRWRRRA